jgi:3-phenylpropionate/trans-cinnamate dioxygenase ferredoxin subunit
VKLVEVKQHSIGIFNVNGEFVAALNVCPHELAPVCRGRLGGTTLPSAPGEYRWGRQGEILACPWHGWEFDLLTGRALADPRVRLRLYSVIVEEDTIFITL